MLLYRKRKNIDDVRYILEHLREEDKHEAYSVYGDDYIERCLSGIMNSRDYFVLGCKVDDDTPVVMGGISETDEDGVGVVWLLSTPEIVNFKTTLFRNLIVEMREIDRRFFITYNCLYKENDFAKNYLQKLGYNFDIPKPVGLNVPDDFVFFYRKRQMRGLS